MVHNKKAMNMGVLIIVGVVVVVLLIVLFAKGVFANGKLNSLSPKAGGYNVRNCPDLSVLVSGFVNIEDSGGITLNPSIKEITADELRVNNKQLCFLCSSSDFTYTVKGIDTKTGTTLNTFEGNGVLRDTENNGIKKPYSLYFTLPDFDCNHQLDDFDLTITAELQGKDIGDVKTQSKFIQVRRGNIIQ